MLGPQITGPSGHRESGSDVEMGGRVFQSLGPHRHLGDCCDGQWTGCLPVWWGMLMDEKGAGI